VTLKSVTSRGEPFWSYYPSPAFEESAKDLRPILPTQRSVLLIRLGWIIYWVFVIGFSGYLFLSDKGFTLKNLALYGAFFLALFITGRFLGKALKRIPKKVKDPVFYFHRAAIFKEGIQFSGGEEHAQPHLWVPLQDIKKAQYDFHKGGRAWVIHSKESRASYYLLGTGDFQKGAAALDELLASR
jgi:hypothetical protein